MKLRIFSNILIFSLLFAFLGIRAQFPPPVGHPGTTAMSKDSSAFISWAETCTIERGFINISDTSLTYNGSNRPTYGSYLYASGPADEFVVSLGDHGIAVLGFNPPVRNGPGHDFAVFENSFNDKFLELAFVEVSSDGIHFVRFPAVSLTPESPQIQTFDTIDATHIHNLAGKYRHGYGTPFDLSDLNDSAGINLNSITQIRIFDVTGSVDDSFCTFDSQGHKVNDPWPTPFDTGGFDLDAVGVIHNTTEGIDDSRGELSFDIKPNPVADYLHFTSSNPKSGSVIIRDIMGQSVINQLVYHNASIDLSSVKPGIYFVTFFLDNHASASKKLIKF